MKQKYLSIKSALALTVCLCLASPSLGNHSTILGNDTADVEYLDPIPVDAVSWGVNEDAVTIDYSVYAKEANIKRYGFKANVYNPFIYVTLDDLNDFQHAVMCYPRNVKKKGSLDYSPYFESESRRKLGRKYSDFLVNLVRRHCKNINYPLPPKNKPLPEDAVIKLREYAYKQVVKFSELFFRELSDDFDNAYLRKQFTKNYKKYCCAEIKQAMRVFKDAFPEDNYLGNWQIFWSGTPSSIKSMLKGWNTGPWGSNYVITICPYNKNDTEADPILCPRFIVEIASVGKHLHPAIVGLHNPRYGIDISMIQSYSNIIRLY